MQILLIGADIKVSGSAPPLWNLPGQTDVQSWQLPQELHLLPGQLKVDLSLCKLVALLSFCRLISSWTIYGSLDTFILIIAMLSNNFNSNHRSKSLSLSSSKISTPTSSQMLSGNFNTKSLSLEAFTFCNKNATINKNARKWLLFFCVKMFFLHCRSRKL